MKSAALQELEKLARLNGVQISYTDMRGQTQMASPDALASVFHALGLPAGNTRLIRDSLRETKLRSWKRCVEPVIVAWDKRPTKIELRVAANSAGKSARCELKLENGETRKFILATRDAQNANSTNADSISHRDFSGSLKEITLPALPFGYHALEVEIGKQRADALVISAPTKSFSPRRVREWGFFLPMYAAHSKQSWGAGNFSDWQQLSEFAGSLGAGVSASLPLLAAFLDHPVCEPSPYSPASRLFWNEFYLDIPAIPEFARCAAAKKLVQSASFQNRLARFREQSVIDYKAQWRARRQVLELLAHSFFAEKSSRTSEFENFLKRRPEVEDYARFRAVCDHTKVSWRAWPRRMRDGNLRDNDCDERVRKFHCYTQWLAQEQLSRVLKNCRERGVKFYLDLPLGVNSDGYDVWRERESFALDACVGAPPDAFFTKGQNWGFSPLHPLRIRELGYRYVRDFLAFQMRHTGMLRIDHVMGLHRLFWVPKNLPKGQGAYVNYPAEELMAILSLESHRHKTMIVGENLGTVPPEVNENMKRHGLRGMFVAQFEQRADANAALPRPPRRVVASINTHDTPTFAAHWRGLDLDDQLALGLISKKELAEKRVAGKKLNRSLAAFLASEGFLRGKKPEPKNILQVCLEWLAASPAEIVLVNLEDLWLEKNPQNVPGTSDERPNWRRKAKLTIEAIRKNREIKNALRTLKRFRATRVSPDDATISGR
jgi:4-alpha-glucanotransferase